MTISRNSALVFQPDSRYWTASQSSSSGWLGSSPWVPKSSSVSTSRAEDLAQKRLTATRAVSGLLGSTSHRASPSRFFGAPAGQGCSDLGHARLDHVAGVEEVPLAQDASHAATVRPAARPSPASSGSPAWISRARRSRRGPASAPARSNGNAAPAPRPGAWSACRPACRGSSGLLGHVLPRGRVGGARLDSHFACAAASAAWASPAFAQRGDLGVDLLDSFGDLRVGAGMTGLSSGWSLSAVWLKMA